MGSSLIEKTPADVAGSQKRSIGSQILRCGASSNAEKQSNDQSLVSPQLLLRSNVSSVSFADALPVPIQKNGPRSAEKMENTAFRPGGSPFALQLFLPFRQVCGFFDVVVCCHFDVVFFTGMPFLTFRSPICIPCGSFPEVPG
jgi:hypothetical protein